MSQRVDLTQFYTRRQSDTRYLKSPVPANPPTSLTQNASAIVQGTTDFFAYIDVHLTDPAPPTGVNAPQYVQAYLFTYSYVSAGVTVVKSVYLPWLSGGIYRVQPVPPGASVSINAETVDFTGQKSVNSSTLSATAASDSTAPAAPTITGSAVNSGGQITITSGLNAESDFDHYELWRGTGPDSGHITWDSTPIIKFFGTSIVDTAIATSTTYWYKVIAKDFSGNSSTSNIAGPLALTTTAASPPSTPNMTGSAATPQPDGSITFTFHPNSDVTLSGYRIWRRVHGTTQWELIHTITASPGVPDPVSYNDASTILGTQYDYTVTAISTTAGESGFPAAFATGTAAETQVPNAVTNVTITGRVGGVVVKWTPSTSTDVVSYTTNYRLTTAGSFQASDEVVTTNNLQILGLTATRDALANQLQVRVIAVNKAGIQSTSVLTTADFPSLATYRPADNTIPTGPASITITKNDDGSILLSWPASVSVDRSGYQIEIWDSVSAAWSILTTIDNDQSGTITYRVVGLEPFKFRSKQYRFRVRTVDYSGNISSVNLVENPGFETGSLSPNWSNNSGTGFVATIQASSAFEGTDCLKSNNAASVNQSVTVAPNVPYTLSAFIAQDPSFPGEIATIRIDWYNSGTFLSSAVSVNITTSSTYQRAVVTSTAPGTATRALLVLVGSTVNPTRTVLHDAVQFEQAAGASGYYDGKTPLVNAIDNQAPQDYSNVSGTNFLNMSVQGMLGQITLHWSNPPASFAGAYDYINGVFEVWRQVTASNQSTLAVDASPRKIVEVPANPDGAANKFDDLDPIETASVTATYFLKARDQYGNSSAGFLNGGVGLSATSITLSQNQDSLVHEGTASGSTPAFSYHQISAQSYVIASGDKLEYDVFVELNTANLYQFALDFEYGASHLAFRSTSILDQNGLSATPATDISAFAKATWYHRIFDLTSLAGQTINTWASAHEADTSAKYRGRLANIKITNGSTLKSIIYSSGSVGTTTAWTIGGAGDTNYSSVNVYTSDLSVGSVNLDVQVSDGTTFLRQFGYSAEPLIGNPTFEQGGASPTGSDSGWVASIGSTANMTYETSAPLAGSRSLKLTGTIGNNIQMVNRMKFTAKPGDVVFLQGLGSVSVAGVKGFLGVQFSDQTGAGSGAGTIAFTSTTPGTLSLQTTAGANTVSGFIYAKYDSTSTANGSALFDSILASRVRSLDNEIADGTTYGRPILTRLNAGRPLIDFSESIHLSKHLGNIPDDVGSTRFAVSTIDAARRALIDFSQGGHSNKILDNISDGVTFGRPLLSRLSVGKPLIDFSEGIHLNKILDNIGDGATFGRPLLARLSSGKPWIDFSEGIHANKHLGNILDDLTSGRIAWDPTSKSRGQSQGNLVLNGSFDRGDTYNWVPGSPEYTGTATSYTLVQSISIDSSDGGRIGNFAGDSISVLTQYLTPVTTGRRYLVEVRLRAGTGTAGAFFYAGFACFDKSKAYIPLGPVGATFTYVLASNLATPSSWTTYSAVITGEELAGDHSVAPNDSQQTDVHKFRFGTKYITPLLLLNRTVTGATTDVDYVKIVELSSVAENHPRFTNLDNAGALDFAPTHRNKHLGNIPDDSGSTRFAVSSVDAARKALIDFSQGGHANKQLDNIPDGTTYARMHATYLTGGQLLTSEFPGATVNPDGSMSGTVNVKSSRTLNNLPVGSTLNILMVGQKAASTDSLGLAVGNANFVLGGSYYNVVWQNDNNLVIYKVVSGVSTPLINGFYSTSDTNIHSLSFTIVTGAATNILTASIDGQDALSISDPAIAFTGAGFISLCTGKMWDFEVSSNNLDQVPDGPTYSRPLKTRINAGRPWIDFTETIHIGKILDNIGDGSGFGRSPLGFYGGGGPSGKLTGFSINDNPDFLSGLARYSVYDNAATGHVTLSLVADTTAPNASGQKMRVSYSAGGEIPGWGGFFLGFSQDSGNVAPFTYHRGNTLIHKIVANIPVGYTINFSSNATGAEGTFTWISSTAGTGAWATYVGKQRIGITGTFSSTGFYYLNGQAAPPASFDVAHCEVVDIDQVHRYGVASIDANFRAGIDFTQTLHVGKNVDNLSDGSTFGRPLLSRLSSGKPFIDFTESIHIGKNLDNIGEGASFKRVGASWVDVSSRVLIDFSLGAHLNRSQDFIPDGTTYQRSGTQAQDNIVLLGTSAGGGGNNFAYRQFSTQAYTIVSGDKLQYDFFQAANNPEFVGGIDFEYGGTHTQFRGAGINDQNGIAPIGDASAFAKGRWYHRVFDLSSIAGFTTNTWAFALEGNTAGSYVSRAANIIITNGSTTKAVIFSSGALGATSVWAAGGAGTDTGYSNVNISTADLSAGAVGMDYHVTDGTTYGRVQNTALTGNQIDMAKSGVVGKAVELVRNPDFESGSRDWTLETGFSIVNDGNAYTGTWALKSVISSGAAAGRNAIFIAVQPGDTILAMCMIKRTVGDATGAVRVTFQNSGGTEIGTVQGNAITSSTYGRSRVSAVAPASAVTARVECVTGFVSTASTLYYDQFNATMTLKNADELQDGTGSPLAGGKRGFSAIDSGNIVITTAIDFSRGYSNKHLDNIPDGSTYSRALGTRINAGRPFIDFTETIHIGKNLDNITDTITYQRKRPASLRAVDTPYNSDFEIWADNSTTGDGWTPAFEGTGSGSTYSRGAGFFGNFGQSIATTVGNGGSVSSRPVPVRPNTKYEISARYISNVATTSGLYLRVCWYLNDGDFSRGSTSACGHSLDDVLTAAPTTTSWQFAAGTWTSPSDAKYAVVAFYNYLPNVNATFTFDSVNMRPADVANVDGGVDANGNLKLKNIAQAVGTTSGPGQLSSTYATIPEMSLTRTTHGNAVQIEFMGALYMLSGGGNYALFIDGTQATQDLNVSVSGGVTCALSWMSQPASGSHTFDIRWHGDNFNSVNCFGTSRALQLYELG